MIPRAITMAPRAYTEGTTSVVSNVLNIVCYMAALGFVAVCLVLAVLTALGSGCGVQIESAGLKAVAVASAACLVGLSFWSGLWRIPFSFARVYSFDGEVLTYSTLWSRAPRRQHIEAIRYVRLEESRHGHPLFVRIGFSDGTILCLGNSLSRKSPEWGLVQAVERALIDRGVSHERILPIGP